MKVEEREKTNEFKIDKLNVLMWQESSWSSGIFFAIMQKLVWKLHNAVTTNSFFSRCTTERG